jgi:NADH dehydrogenase FAD-containing subunit
VFASIPLEHLPAIPPASLQHYNFASYHLNPTHILVTSTTMVEQRNIVVLGGGPSGLLATHYILKHVIPTLKAKHTSAKYHVYNVNPSADFYFRVASPRVATSTTLMAAEKVFGPISGGFEKYSADDFTFIQAFATGLDTDARKVSYQRDGHLSEELSYHALVVVTGSKTHHPAFSMPTTKEATMDAIKSTNVKAAAAKDIVIVGGGPTGVEVAGELAEFRNGRPGWFSPVQRKVNITLVTATNQLLPTIPLSTAKTAENKLRDLGVEVVYNTRVANTSEMQDGRTKVQLANGKELKADLFIPAYGVLPNSTWLPSKLLNKTNYLITNQETLRVDIAGPRVYSFGDVSSASRNTVADILDMMPVAMINIKRDLISYNPATPTAPAPGKDRIFTPAAKVSMIAPIGSRGGVGSVMGWSVPSFFVWLLKGRDYMVGLSFQPTLGGDTVKKDFKWTAEEAVA